MMTTKERILNAGKKEFFEHGFRAASLRHIVKKAGVTTGAFYGYFRSKEDLFQALVDEPAKGFINEFIREQNEFASLPPTSQPDQMSKIDTSWMVEFVYEHFDAFKLIICCSDGTEYGNFIHDIVEIELEATHRFVDILRELGHQSYQLDEQLEHILVSGLFSAFFEMVIHDMPKEKALINIKELRDFYTAGWQKIMGL